MKSTITGVAAALLALSSSAAAQTTQSAHLQLGQGRRREGSQRLSRRRRDRGSLHLRSCRLDLPIQHHHGPKRAERRHNHLQTRCRHCSTILRSHPPLLAGFHLSSRSIRWNWAAAAIRLRQGQ